MDHYSYSTVQYSIVLYIVAMRKGDLGAASTCPRMHGWSPASDLPFPRGLCGRKKCDHGSARACTVQYADAFFRNAEIKMMMYLFSTGFQFPVEGRKARPLKAYLHPIEIRSRYWYVPTYVHINQNHQYGN